jgi:CRP/FNR family cyclic AMP-dependent transcriptional regulator
MTSTAMNFVTYPTGVEDPLTLLPRTPIRECAKNEVIYGPDDRAEVLYLLIDGRVKVSRMAGSDQEVILEFCHKDDFFGETGFLADGRYGEQATALEKTTLMSWTIGDLKRLIARTPALGSALLQVTVEKLEHERRRIESFCLDPIHRRLAKTLLDLARRGGQVAGEQLIHLMPTTHEQLARYVGTSREIVTQHLNQFRREHLLRYSRQGLDVDPAALGRYLEGV